MIIVRFVLYMFVLCNIPFLTTCVSELFKIEQHNNIICHFLTDYVRSNTYIYIQYNFTNIISVNNFILIILNILLTIIKVLFNIVILGEHKHFVIFINNSEHTYLYKFSQYIILITLFFINFCNVFFI